MTATCLYSMIVYTTRRRGRAGESRTGLDRGMTMSRLPHPKSGRLGALPEPPMFNIGYSRSSCFSFALLRLPSIRVRKQISMGITIGFPFPLVRFRTFLIDLDPTHDTLAGLRFNLQIIPWGSALIYNYHKKQASSQLSSYAIAHTLITIRGSHPIR